MNYAFIVGVKSNGSVEALASGSYLDVKAKFKAIQRGESDGLGLEVFDSVDFVTKNNGKEISHKVKPLEEQEDESIGEISENGVKDTPKRGRPRNSDA